MRGLRGQAQQFSARDKPLAARLHWVELLSLLGILGGVAFFWNTPFVYPLKILVVFFHELSHGLMAIATGGSIQEIQVVEQQGGHCITVGGSRWMILTAGYLGSLAWGGTILMVATRTRFDRVVSVLIGGVLLGTTALWVRPIGSFGFNFGLLAGAVLVLVGFVFGHRLNDYLLKIIGLASCSYAILDIKSDTLDRSELPSDASMLAEEIGGTTFLWGLLWITIAVICSVKFLLFSCKRLPEEDMDSQSEEYLR